MIFACPTCGDSIDSENTYNYQVADRCRSCQDLEKLHQDGLIDGEKLVQVIYVLRKQISKEIRDEISAHKAFGHED